LTKGRSKGIMGPRVGVMDMRRSLQIFGRAGDSGMGPAGIKFGSAQTITETVSAG